MPPKGSETSKSERGAPKGSVAASAADPSNPIPANLSGCGAAIPSASNEGRDSSALLLGADGGSRFESTGANAPPTVNSISKSGMSFDNGVIVGSILVASGSVGRMFAAPDRSFPGVNWLKYDRVRLNAHPQGGEFRDPVALAGDGKANDVKCTCSVELSGGDGAWRAGPMQPARKPRPAVYSIARLF